MTKMGCDQRSTEEIAQEILQWIRENQGHESPITLRDLGERYGLTTSMVALWRLQDQGYDVATGERTNDGSTY
jgi:hypothetical protein